MNYGYDFHETFMKHSRTLFIELCSCVYSIYSDDIVINRLVKTLFCVTAVKIQTFNISSTLKTI